jgi:thioredoxin-like negative regulator of GroEL
LKQEINPETSKETTEMSKEITTLSQIPQKGVTLAKFYFTWCGHCQKIQPVFEQLAKDTKGVLSLVSVNIEKAPQLSQSVGVDSGPTFILFQNGVAQQTNDENDDGKHDLKTSFYRAAQLNGTPLE